MTLSFELRAANGPARRGRVKLARGGFETPVFMPVGTRAAVRTLDSDDLERLGLELVLANTYHLMLRPGAAAVAAVGGLHRFWSWEGLILTDSGGFQVFSLDADCDEEGVSFRNTYDGGIVELTPESAVDIQCQLGSDIQMVLDVCAPLPSTGPELHRAVELTGHWAARARTRFESQRSAGFVGAQFGIVQGGTDPALRTESAERTVAVGFEGYALGGLSVGEGRDAMLETVAGTIAHLPTDRPRYLMGVGDPLGIVESVALGIDMFDCVIPTRLARHGTALTDDGKLNLGRAEFARDETPLAPTGPGSRYSRAYLRHLIKVGELTAAHILTRHNLAWMAGLMGRARDAVEVGTYAALRTEIARVWG